MNDKRHMQAEGAGRNKAAADGLIRLSPEEQMRFVEALINPQPPQ